MKPGSSLSSGRICHTGIVHGSQSFRLVVLFSCLLHVAVNVTKLDIIHLQTDHSKGGILKTAQNDCWHLNCLLLSILCNSVIL